MSKITKWRDEEDIRAEYEDEIVLLKMYLAALPINKLEVLEKLMAERDALRTKLDKVREFRKQAWLHKFDLSSISRLDEILNE